MSDKNTIDRIKSKLKIEDVIGQFISLKKKGSGYVGVCPFHQDSNPSLRVNPAKETFKCFVCQEGGDVIDFVQKHENMSFAEALSWCAKEAKIEIENKELTSEEIKAAQIKESLRIAINASSLYFEKHLSDAQGYLAERGFKLDDQIIKDFRIGYAPADNQAKKDLVSSGYREDLLIKVGVLGESKNHYTYDVFKDRIMFPFLDNQGNVIGFSGRWLTPQENSGKYINTAETPLYTKGKTLFGLYQSRQAINRLNDVYLVEGQFDVLSLYLAGVTNVVAGSGTALTPDQVKLITRYTPNITLVYDADRAGLAATRKNCEQLLKGGINVQCVRLPEGQDPDNIAQEHKRDTGKWLINRKVDFTSYFADVFFSTHPEPAPEQIEEELNNICNLIACIGSETLRLNHIRKAAELFNLNTEIIGRKVKDCRLNLKDLPKGEGLPAGVYGLDLLEDLKKEGQPCTITPNFNDFLEKYGDEPILYINGGLSAADIQSIRKACNYFQTNEQGLSIDRDGELSPFMEALAEMYKAGISDITVLTKEEYDDGDEEDPDEIEWTIKKQPFLKYYIRCHGTFLINYYGEKTPFIERCAEVISYAEDSVRIVNLPHFWAALGITKAAMNEILKPYLGKRKSRMAMAAQRSDKDFGNFDPNEVPAYVEDNPEYADMLKEYGYYPKLNEEGEPVCYMFRNPNNSGYTMVGDFYMTPLLHIKSDDDEQNKRVLKINRRYYKSPLYIEVNSKALLKKANIEERLVYLEAVNFSNGDDKHWIKIKEYMSRNFTTCTEVMTYGNQQIDGHSKREEQMFFAFSNGIYHEVGGEPRFDPVNELGVVQHKGENYYLPAFSTIYAGSGKHSDKYELISQLYYKEVPVTKKCSFEKWASLMDTVYKINDNGKWALLFAIMCAFRSNIHCLDRLFTAPFFMGPMSSGKTQIAISIRSLFISPRVPIFNLNIGTDAAMSTLMSTFRDVPVVLDEYNNKDISDTKFQALKGIVYDGDGKQKRKGTSGKEIENDKVYTPVIICGQETPQRDDNALMSRIIVCEVPKPKGRTVEEVALFNELKDIEDPTKVGLSNVLLDILKCRPLVMDHFRQLKQDAYDELKKELATAGEIDRLMKTASLFLATCKLIEQHTDLQLPFTYAEFFPIAVSKIKTQVELISKSDKLANFFKAMDVMIDMKTILEGREFQIAEADRVTVKSDKNTDKKTEAVVLSPGTRVLYLRVSHIYMQYERGGYTKGEETSQSTIDQNLRSHPSYIGQVLGRRFKWEEVEEMAKNPFENASPDLGMKSTIDNTAIRKKTIKETQSSCIALNYDIFHELYGIDLQRASTASTSDSNIPDEQSLGEAF